MLTRTLIFVPNTDSMCQKLRGIITFSGDGAINGRMKLFNVDASIYPLMLGIQIGEKKTSFGDLRDETFDFLFQGDINEDIYVVLATMENEKIICIATATNSTNKFDYTELFVENEEEIQNVIDENIIKGVKEELNLVKDTETLEIKTEKGQVDFSFFGDLLANENEDRTRVVNYGKNDKYEEMTNIDDEAKLFDDDSLGESKPQIGEGQFYSLIKTQLDELFTRFPHYEELEKNVVNTEWIRVTYSNEGEMHYILGKLFDNGIVSHLCYGIPSNSRATPPPKDLEEYCQWLPLHLDNIDADGYWVMYQRADTGENVRL